MIRRMRPVIVAANWKMNTTPADAGELARTIATRTRESGVIRVLCPPFVCLAAVGDALRGPDVEAPDGRGVAVGAQDVHHEPAGAYTGSISAPMLAGLATWVIVGHSERRRDACETDELIGRKLLAARAHGLRAILCVGEQLAEREAGRAIEVVDRQLRGCLTGADPIQFGSDDDLPWLTIAYEPVWAIGTGKTATPEMAQQAHETIKSVLDLPVLYGGSVKPDNAAELMSQPAVDGALVGGASLDVESFAAICRNASRS
jgi:triosephosphate isomerase (TIM)